MKYNEWDTSLIPLIHLFQDSQILHLSTQEPRKYLSIRFKDNVKQCFTYLTPVNNLSSAPERSYQESYQKYYWKFQNTFNKTFPNKQDIKILNITDKKKSIENSYFIFKHDNSTFSILRQRITNMVIKTRIERKECNIPVDAPLGTAALAKVPSETVISTYNNQIQIQFTKMKTKT